MFGDEVRRAWVEGPGKEGGEHEVDEGVNTEGLIDDEVEGALGKDVEEVD